MWMIFVILFVVALNVFRAILFTFHNFNSFILYAYTFSRFVQTISSNLIAEPSFKLGENF